LNDAISLRNAGFSVIWLKKRSKRPVDEKWTDKETLSVERLKSSYVQGYNCGVRLGKPSVVGGLYLHVLDVDIRKAELASQARKTVESLLKTRFSDFQAVISGSGGASRHLYFGTDKPFRSKKLWHSDDKFLGDDGSEHWGAEIELIGTGKQVVLPPSIHPDTGKPYVWEEGEFYVEDLIEIDSDLLEDLIGVKERHIVDDKGPLGLSEDEIEGYLADLDLATYCEDREGWIKVGMALHHEFDGADIGLKIWNKFSKQSKKFDARISRQQWHSFRGSEQPITFASIIQAANEHRHQIEWESLPDEFNDDEDDPDEDVPPLRKERREEPRRHVEEQEEGIPPHILTIPGVLGLAVEHYNATSTQKQPQFAVQTALALGSVVLGRYWMTEHDNFSSLYLVNLGVTGSGKEFSRKFISRALEEAGLGEIVGPSMYASSAGIMSELAWKPRHITVYDEFGMLLASTGNKSNTNLRDAQRLLMSLFGQLGDVARPVAYSTNGKTAQQIEGMRQQKVVRPAITLLGLSTPETFFDALSQDDVANGFLNRLLVVNSRRDPQVEDPRAWKKIPAELRAWIKEFGKSDSEDFLESEISTEAEDPEVVEFTSGAKARLREIAHEVIDLQAKYRPYRLDGMLSRSREIAMRIALIVALSRNKKRIDEESVNWSWDYVRFYTMETIANTRRMMGSTPIARIADHLADVIAEAGRKGLSQRDMGRKSYEFAKLDSRAQGEVIYALTTHMGIVKVSIKGESRGRPTIRYVHEDYT